MHNYHNTDTRKPHPTCGKSYKRSEDLKCHHLSAHSRVMSPARQGPADNNTQHEATVVEDEHRTECSDLLELQPSQVD